MTDRHWFYIEQVMSEVRGLAQEARDRIERGTPTEAEALFAPAAAGPLPRDPSALLAPGQTADTLRTEVMRTGSLEGSSTDLLFGRPLELDPPPPRAGRPAPGGSEIVALRAQVRERLIWLKGRLSEGLTRREAYHVLFPLVIHVDELILSATQGRAEAWEPLQLAFFEIDDGGERFYDVLDTLLAKEDTLPLVFEVFHFCLGDGFLGLHAHNRAKIEDYRARLAARIPRRPMQEAEPREAESEVRLVEFPRRYYLAAGAAVLGVFLFLHLLTWLELGPR